VTQEEIGSAVCICAWAGWAKRTPGEGQMQMWAESAAKARISLGDISWDFSCQSYPIKDGNHLGVIGFHLKRFLLRSKQAVSLIACSLSLNAFVHCW